MDYLEHSFRHAGSIFRNEEFGPIYNELTDVISDISDQDIIQKHQSYGEETESKTPKSLSVAINSLFKERLREVDWDEESEIFQNPDYSGDRWRLDFAKYPLSLEVAFNHSTVIAWNLIKPVLAGELNHVQKAVQTKGGVIITCTQSLKDAGGFDSAVGTYEKFIEHLDPLRNILTVPLMIIGLQSPITFEIEHHQLEKRKKIGRVREIPTQYEID